MKDALQRAIYVIAAVSLAWGTTDFILHRFGQGVTGWRNAVVTVATIEALFVLLVAKAKEGKAPRWLPLGPLTITAMIQIAKASEEIGAATDPATKVLTAAIPCMAVAALGIVVYLFEIPRTVAPTIAPDAQGVAFDPLQLSQLIEAGIDARIALLAQAQPDGATESEGESGFRVVPKPQPQLKAGETWKAQVAQLVAEANETGTKVSYTHIATKVGKSRTAVAAEVKAQAEGQP